MLPVIILLLLQFSELSAAPNPLDETPSSPPNPLNHKLSSRSDAYIISSTGTGHPTTTKSSYYKQKGLSEYQRELLLGRPLSTIMEGPHKQIIKEEPQKRTEVDSHICKIS